MTIVATKTTITTQYLRSIMLRRRQCSKGGRAKCQYIKFKQLELNLTI